MASDASRCPPRAAPKPGSIALATGPMFSGKTTRMLSWVARERAAGNDVLVVKHAKDDRLGDSETLVTHGQSALKTQPRTDECGAVHIVTAASLLGVDVGSYTVVAVDEGQFFSDIVAAAEKWADAGIRVYVAALDGDFSRAPFGAICDLLPRCERVEKHTAVCDVCKGDASFTARICGEPVRRSSHAKTVDIAVGGRETYRAMCRACHAAHSA